MRRTKFNRTKFRRTRFKGFPDRPGIYVIQSTVNNKQYVGSAVKLKGRKRGHFNALKRGDNTPHMQNHYNKYGEDDLQFSIIEYCAVEKLIEREQYYIDTLKPEFNICQTAGSMFGFRFSEESKRKIRDNHADFSGENHPGFGSRRSEESKQKSSKTKKAFYQTEEGLKVRKSVGESNKGNISWCKGLTKETDSRLKKAGEKISKNEERSKKIRNALKGHSVSEKTKQKNRESQIERMANPELKQRHKEAALRQWQDPEWRKNHVGKNYRKGIRKQKVI